VHLTDTSLRLFEVENGNTIGVGLVVGRRDRLDFIPAIFNITAHHPLAAVPALAIANVKAGIDRPVMRLAALCEAEAPRTGA
jgi:hypothetical protein